MKSAFDLAPLKCPFPVQLNPHATRLEQHLLDWAVRWGLLRDAVEEARFRKGQYGLLPALVNPDADFERLALIAEWYMWLFLHDDRVCDEASIGHEPGRMAAILQRRLSLLEDPAGVPEDVADPLQESLRDLRRRLAACASEVQWARFMDAVRGFFFGLVWEAANRAASKVPALADYVSMRRHTGAVQTALALTDVGGGYEIPASDWHRPAVRHLSMAAVDAVCFGNDILSFSKEVRQGQDFHNMPSVLMAHAACTLPEALAETARRYDEAVRLFTRTEAEILPWAGDELRRYANGLRAWIRGNNEWSCITARYNDAA